MISLDSIQVQRGTAILLDDASVKIHDGWRVAVVGKNGCGKSTLFKILQGTLHVDGGEMHIPSTWRISEMKQEVHEVERTALEYILDGDKALRDLQQRLATAEQGNDDHLIAKLHGELDNIDGYNADYRAEQLLHGLGFADEKFHLPVSSFSGGWRIRLNLAQALMAPSDLLLLDEPTNHLDLEAVLWLEKYLNQYKGTLVFISHDRDFIDAVAGQILSFEHQNLQLYKGNYSGYERQRAERLAQQQQVFEKQQVRIAEIEKFVTRFKAKASKAKQAQSRVKELERMEMIAPAHVDSQFNFSFREADQVSDPLLTTADLELGYTNTLIGPLNLSIHPGMRVGLLGRNGAGKSTFIKAIANGESILKGDITGGQHLAVGYFAQHQLEALDLNASPLLHIQRLSKEMNSNASEQAMRNYLGGYGFQGDDCEEQVKRFSGGEKARLAFSLIAWQKPNLLLLDEPTNHLDLEVRHALTMAMQTYEGAILVVSHDRHLLANTVDEFWLVDHGKVEEFKGDLKDYQKYLADHQKQTTQLEKAQKQAEKVESDGGADKKIDRKEQKRREAEIRKQLSPIKKQLDKLEKQVDKATETLESVEEKLNDTGLYDDDRKKELQQVLADQIEAKQNLEELEMQWMDQQEVYEDAMAELG